MSINFDLTDEFYVEEWRVEPKLGRLTRDAEFHQIEPKIMQVLVCLAENHGKVIRKQEFLSDIWEGVNVTQHVLARTISELRRVFGDDPQNPRFIQTIPKIGYRLIANVSEGNDHRVQFERSDVNPDMPFQYEENRVRPSNLIFFAGGVLTVIVVFATLAVFLLRMQGGSHFHN